MVQELPNRIRLVRLLKRGASSEVHEAVLFGTGLERRVAVKFVSVEGLGASEDIVAESILDEARLTSHLHHAGIVATYGLGLHQARPYLIMELIDGLDVERLLARCAERQQQFPLAVALHVAVEVAHALAYAHSVRDGEGRSLGLVHRDVTPRNVLVSWSGDVKLTDFGIAKARDKLVRTKVGHTKGSAGFMSPEQVAGASIDFRTDLYALGCLLHVMLTGRTPAPGDVDDSLPEELRAIIHRAVRFEPHERFRSADELASALGALLAKRLRLDGRSTLVRFLQSFSPPVPVVSENARLGHLFSFSDPLLGLSSDAGEEPSGGMTRTVAMRGKAVSGDREGDATKVTRLTSTEVIFENSGSVRETGEPSLRSAGTSEGTDALLVAPTVAVFPEASVNRWQRRSSTLLWLVSMLMVVVVTVLLTRFLDSRSRNETLLLAPSESRDGVSAQVAPRVVALPKDSAREPSNPETPGVLINGQRSAPDVPRDESVAAPSVRAPEEPERAVDKKGGRASSSPKAEAQKLMELRKSLEAALNERGLKLSDLESPMVREWQQSFEENNVSRAQRAHAQLFPLIRDFTTSPAVVADRLRALSERIALVRDAKDASTLENQFFELQARSRETRTTKEFAVLLRELRALEQRAAAALR